MHEFIRFLLTKHRNGAISDPSVQRSSPLPAASRIFWVNSTTQESSSLAIALFALRKYGRTDRRTQPEGKIASRW